MSSKKLHSLTLLIAVVLLIVTLTACGSSVAPAPPTAPRAENSIFTTAPEATDKPPATSPTETSEATTENRVVLESDPFPDFWIGEWVCTKSEQEVMIKEWEMAEFLDYKNKMSVTEADGYTDDWWIYYDADTNLFLLYNKDEFVEDEYFYDFEVVKQTETQIILNRIGFGSEVVLEKP